MRMAFIWAVFPKIAPSNPIHSVTNFWKTGFLGSSISLRILFTSLPYQRTLLLHLLHKIYAKYTPLSKMETHWKLQVARDNNQQQWNKKERRRRSWGVRRAAIDGDWTLRSMQFVPITLYIILRNMYQLGIEAITIGANDKVPLLRSYSTTMFRCSIGAAFEARYLKKGAKLFREMHEYSTEEMMLKRWLYWRGRINFRFIYVLKLHIFMRRIVRKRSKDIWI